MKTRLTIVSLVLTALGLASVTPVRAEYVEFLALSGVFLPGKVTINPGGTITLRHSKGNFYFKKDEVVIHKGKSIREQYAAMLSKAKGSKNAANVYTVARWALKHAMLKEFYEAINDTLAFDSQHEGAKKVKALKAQMDVPVAEVPQLEQDLRKFCSKPEMKIQTSNHFILLHDLTASSTGTGKSRVRRDRATERLALLEKVYESFMLTFFSQGVPLEVPQERLKVVMFANHADYTKFSVAQDATLRFADGYWSPVTNISVFYDHATNDRMKELSKIGERMQKEVQDLQRRGARGLGELKHVADTIKLLGDMEQEGADVEVVSHECTHQIAGNTGLLPRHVRVPRWVHEGLAAYFESPSDTAGWSGVGAVNEQRIMFYRALAPDREHSNINFIVADKIFTFAGDNIGNILHGYGQAWALTHFLMESHFDKFILFYKKLGEMPPDIALSPEILTGLFDSVFGPERANLDVEWRAYMDGLKTDLQIVLDAE